MALTRLTPQGCTSRCKALRGSTTTLLTWYYTSRLATSVHTNHHCIPAFTACCLPPLRQRGGGAAAGVQALGRLDQDTTGLLVLSDDGKFIHRLTSPKHHVTKVYDITTKHAVDAQQIDKLLAGVVLDDSPKPVAAFAAEQTGEYSLRLTLTEGKYHQVKRMLAAVSNRVEGLHRSQMGALTLDSLPSGEWRWLTPQEVVALSAKTT